MASGKALKISIARSALDLVPVVDRWLKGLASQDCLGGRMIIFKAS